MRTLLGRRSNPLDQIMEESTSKEILSRCASIGIQMQHSVPYTPQQNGVAKRNNKYLKEMDTVLIEEKPIPLYLWDEA